MKTKKVPLEILSIKESIGTNIMEEYGIYHLNINPVAGSGKVTCIGFDKYITAIDLDLKLRSETKIVLKSSKKNPLYFLYVLEGEIYQENSQGKLRHLENLRSIVMTDTNDNTQNIVVKEQDGLRLNILIVDKDAYFEKFLNGYYQSNIRLEKLLNSFDSIANNLHIGSYSLKITEQLRKLHKDTKYNDVTDFLYLEGIYHLIMAYHIEQFYDDIKRDKRITNLSDYELKSIGELSEYIVARPESQHNIDDLCRRAGMSPAKLQEGFKHFHGKTVLNYIRHVRLQKAETLLLNSDLNISEVVYSIGFTSRSYFCKIFKAKFKCTPKEYRKNVHSKLMSKVA